MITIRKNNIEFFALLIALFCIFSLNGCKQNDEIIIESATLHVEASNADFQITDKSNLNTIEEYIDAGFKEDGFMDYAFPPPYKLTIEYSDRSSKIIYVHLYVKDENSHFLYSQATSTGYTVNIANSLKLKKIIDQSAEENSP